jgi:RNA polymerase II elongation factor ELL
MFTSNFTDLCKNVSSDGMKDKDRKLLMPLLSQVAALKNNEYILNRGIWNDIQEDWPFYTEQEKQVMKRYESYIYLLGTWQLS